MIERPDQVWCADITYVSMPRGFLYLVAVIDWWSRYVVAWALSNSLEGTFCRTALQQALRSGTPLIFNTDQGSQFTAQGFTILLETANVHISMDGRGRVFDNIFIERLWRRACMPTSSSTIRCGSTKAWAIVHRQTCITRGKTILRYWRWKE